jgi:hypothetical protein
VDHRPVPLHQGGERIRIAGGAEPVEQLMVCKVAGRSRLDELADVPQDVTELPLAMPSPAAPQSRHFGDQEPVTEKSSTMPSAPRANNPTPPAVEIVCARQPAASSAVT